MDIETIFLWLTINLIVLSVFVGLTLFLKLIRQKKSKTCITGVTITIQNLSDGFMHKDP